MWPDRVMHVRELGLRLCSSQMTLGRTCCQR